MNRDLSAATVGLNRLVGLVVNDTNEPRSTFILVDVFHIELGQFFTSATGIRGNQRYPEHCVTRPALSVLKLLKLSMAEQGD